MKWLCALLTRDTREPKGSFSIINMCQFLYAATFEPKIGASNLIRQLGYEPLDPDHLPLSDDKTLGLLTYRLFISATPNSCKLTGREEVGAESPGCQSLAQKNSLLMSSKLSASQHVPFSLSQWAILFLQALVWWDTQSHLSREDLMSQGQANTPELLGSLPGKMGWEMGNATQEKREGFLAPASPLAHSVKAGSNQALLIQP